VDPGKLGSTSQSSVSVNGSKVPEDFRRFDRFESKRSVTSATARSLTLEMLLRMLRDRGVERLFFKKLAPNDNSKNQIYLGGELSVLNVLPSGDLEQQASSSKKPGASARQRLKAPVPLFWLDAEGGIHGAPNAQLILYPQYPEVRLSGFLLGSSIHIGEWFDPNKKGRLLGRILMMGVARDGRLYCYLALPGSVLEKQIASLRALTSFGALTEVLLNENDGTAELFQEIRRIHDLKWIVSKRLDAHHNLRPCNSPNCGGYTLEAELGITPNGYAEPDFRGWEVKSFGVSNFDSMESQVITLMTPEPDGGLYKDFGVEAFVRRYGYPDVGGRPDRINFGGVHVLGRQHPKTRLRLVLTDFEEETGKIKDVNGGIALLSENDCAALWTYRKLIEHWKKKHDKAVYVPNKGDLGPPRRYCYGSQVLLGRGADFEGLLKAFIAGDVYYDPGIKLEGASGDAPKIKRRSQFRIKVRNLASLYHGFERAVV
jgi:hypothetical protein